jgi:hypothetical protein
MNISLVSLWSFIALFILYALKGELFNSTDSYKSGIPIEGDSFPRLIRKIDVIIQSRFTSIKWRKVMLTTFFIMALMFYFIDHKIPYDDPKKIITYFCMIFIPLYILFLYDSGTELKNLSNNSHKWFEIMREKYLSKSVF